jgi:uncharacterized membrane protein HdeD (DUF308 family)
MIIIDKKFYFSILSIHTHSVLNYNQIQIIMYIKIINKIKEFLESNKKTRKVIGVILILVGLFALITPLTPGAWLAIVGFELLGMKILFLNKFKFWNKKKNSVNKEATAI